MNQPTITIEDAITFSVLHRLPDWEWLNPEWQKKQDDAMATMTMVNPFSGERFKPKMPTEEEAAEACSKSAFSSDEEQMEAEEEDWKAGALREIAERN